MSSSQGTFIYRTFLARPATRVVTIKRGGKFRSSDDNRARDIVESHYMDQLSRRKASMLGRVSNSFSNSNYLNSSSPDPKRSFLGSADVDVDDTLPRRYWEMPNVRYGRFQATTLNPAQYTQEQVQSHMSASTSNISLQLGSTGRSAVALWSTPTTWVAPSRTVRVAYQADSTTKIKSSSASVLPQYAKRVRRINTQNQSSPLWLSNQVPDLSVPSTAGEEAWERAAQKLGLLRPPKSMTASAYKAETSLFEVEPAKTYMPSSLAVETKSQLEPFRFVESCESTSERPRRKDIPEPLNLSDPVPELKLEPESSSEKIVEDNQPCSHADELKSTKAKKTPAGKRSTTEKAVADGLVVESKPIPKARKKSVTAQPEEKISPDINVTNDPPVSILSSVEPSNEDLLEERQSFPNESVMVIDNAEKARMAVEQLMGEYKDLVHACDTEVLLQ